MSPKKRKYGHVLDLLTGGTVGLFIYLFNSFLFLLFRRRAK
jgi:hypothetical protein